MENDVWCVAVFRCSSDNAKETLVDFYDFVKDLLGVRDLHFVIRDCVEDDVVFSFRIRMEAKAEKVVRSKLDYKLRSLVPEDEFAVNPPFDNPLHRYAAWDYEERIKKHGTEKFDAFCCFLSQLGRTVVDMAKKGYFASAERVEMAHVVCWMLGCTEYSILTASHIETGYYDRIEDRYHPYLKQNLGK